MRNVAIIAAAGWKGAGHGFKGQLADIPEICLPLETCPESLLPLGDGSTVLSRWVRQLRDHDFTAIFAVVGQPGCLFPTIRDVPGTAHHTTPEQAAVCATQTPWTWERLNYVASLATPILSPDPNYANFEDSYARGLDAIGSDWDRLLMLHGDTVVSDGLLQTTLAQEPSCFVELHPYHNLIWLTREHAEAYRELQEERHRRQGGGCALAWCNAVKGLGIRLYKLGEAFPKHFYEWRDIDYRGDFQAVTTSREGRPSWMEQYG